MMQEHTRTQAVTSLPLNFAASQELECEFLLIEVWARRNALIEFSTFFCHRIITSSGFGEGCEKDRQRRDFRVVGVGPRLLSPPPLRGSGGTWQRRACALRCGMGQGIAPDSCASHGVYFVHTVPQSAGRLPWPT